MIKHKLTSLKKINNFFNFENTINNSFIVARGRYNNDLCNIIGGIALNQVCKVNIHIISDFAKKEINELFSIFGLKKIINIFSYKKFYKDLSLFLETTFIALYYFLEVKKKGFDWLINHFKLKNVRIGDLIYDTYIKHNHLYLKPKTDIFFFKILFESIFKFFKLFKIVEIYKPKFIQIGTEAYAYNEGILMRIALSKKITVFEVQAKFLIENKKYQTKYGRDHLRFASNFLEKIDKNKILSHFLKKIKLKTLSSYTDTYFLANKFKKNKEIFKNLDRRYDKIILIAPHAFTDAPHSNGELLFRDFYHQFIETLKFIKKTRFEKNILWLIKHHPANFLYNETNIFNDIIFQFLSNNIVKCPSNINTNYLINNCDHVITTNGSIGLEFASQGKLPILGGKSPYSNLGFSFDPKKKSEYFKAIRNIHNFKKLNKKQIFNAKKATFFLDTALYKYSLKQSKIFNFDKYHKSYNKGLLKNKFISNQKSFLNESIKNLINKDLFKDPYFLSIRNYFEENYKKL